MSDETPQAIKDCNKALCEKYPFLIPSNRWSDKHITEASDGGYWPGSPEEVPKYDYDYTELDDMPDGWRIAFGDQLLEELKQELVESGHLEDYRITQIKEKYGSLRWYDIGGTEKWDTEIFPKYEDLSARTCIICGKPAEWISKGWISPYCDDCAKAIVDNNRPYYYTWEYTQYYKPIDEFFAEEEEPV